MVQLLWALGATVLGQRGLKKLGRPRGLNDDCGGYHAVVAQFKTIHTRKNRIDPTFYCGGIGLIAVSSMASRTCFTIFVCSVTPLWNGTTTLPPLFSSIR